MTVSETRMGQPRYTKFRTLPVIDEGHNTPSRALVVILDGGPAADEQAPSSDGHKESQHLRESLTAAEARLTASRAEHETTIQDLRVANEELQSINEEYRSASEELETSKEELQSMNEELRTVNAELKSKLDSIASAHSDLKNIVAATDIGTLFLDRKLRIRMFTPHVAELFNITELDVGRAITDFTHRLDDEGIAADVQGVLRDLNSTEREVATRDGRWLVMRLRPYRTIDERIEGAVVTFVDVTAQREMSERLRESDEQKTFLLKLSDVLRPIGDPVKIRQKTCDLVADWFAVECACHLDMDEATKVPLVNGGAASRAKPVSMSENPLGNLIRATETGSKGFSIPDLANYPSVSDEDKRDLANLGMVSCMGAPLLKDGEIVAALVVGCERPRNWTAAEVELLQAVADRVWSVIKRVSAELALRKSEERFRALIKASSDVLYRMNPDWTQMLELHSDGFLTETVAADSGWIDRYILPDDQARVWAHIQEVIRKKIPFELEHRVQQADGTIGWTFSRAIPMLDDEGEIFEWFGAAGDITERRASEERLREARDALHLATEASQLGWGAWDFGTGAADWDARGREIIGLGKDENTNEAWLEGVS